MISIPFMFNSLLVIAGGLSKYNLNDTQNYHVLCKNVLSDIRWQCSEINFNNNTAPYNVHIVEKAEGNPISVKFRLASNITQEFNLPREDVTNYIFFRSPNSSNFTMVPHYNLHSSCRMA